VLHDRYVEGMRACDADAMVDVFSPSAQAGIRDYVADTATLTHLNDLDGMRQYHRAFFDRFDVQAVDVLERVAQDWFVFAEVRIEAVVRTGERQGSRVAFHTGELFIPGRENKFMVQLGHGTDLAESETAQPAAAMAEAAG